MVVYVTAYLYLYYRWMLDSEEAEAGVEAEIGAGKKDEKLEVAREVQMVKPAKIAKMVKKEKTTKPAKITKERKK